MSSCRRCNSPRIIHVNAKASDRCFISSATQEHAGYVLKGLGIGGGDYVEFSYCLECGQMQGTFPKGKAEIEESSESDN